MNEGDAGENPAAVANCRYTMELLKAYFNVRQSVYDYFGYVEDWRVIPLDDATDYFWTLHQDAEGRGFVGFADSLEELEAEDGNYYQNDIYTQRFLPKWVYRGRDYTMICVDTHTDGNQFLQIFDNAKEVK